MKEKDYIKCKVKFDQLCEKLVNISSFLFLILVFIVLLEVSGRYIFNSPFSFTGELTQLLFPWIVFLAFVSVTYHNGHICLLFFVDKLPKKIRTIINFFNKSLMILFIFLIFLGSTKLSIAVSGDMVGTLRMSKIFYYLSLVVSFAMLFCMQFSKLILSLINGKRK